MLEPIFPPALCLRAAVAVAVVSPPTTVTVPTMLIPVPLGAKLRMSPPTVTRPPAVSVWPANTRLEMIDAEGLVTNVEGAEGAAPLMITALPVGDNEIDCPSTVMTPPGVKVCDPITIRDDASSVNVDCPTTITGIGDVRTGGGDVTGDVGDPVIGAESEWEVLMGPGTMMPPAGVVVEGPGVAPVSVIALLDGVTDGSFPLVVVCVPTIKSDDPSLVTD
jgi:hypothetical protein